MLVVKFREKPGMVSPAHETVQVFIGASEGSLGLSGELVMSHEEWGLLRHRIRLEQTRNEEAGVRFVSTWKGETT